MGAGLRTSAPHAALSTEPLPVRDALRSLPNAAQVEGCGAPITAEEVPTQRAQHAGVHVLILVILLGLYSDTVTGEVLSMARHALNGYS